MLVHIKQLLTRDELRSVREILERATWGDGRVVVREGHLSTLEQEPLVERHNRLAIQLAESAR